jgi:hypothetical protein
MKMKDKNKMIWNKELGIYLLPRDKKNEMVWDKELGIYKIPKTK